MGETIKLADFIRQKMKEQNLSTADVARRSGNEISPTTITKILNGEVQKSGAKTLGSIAKGLGINELDVFRVANGEDITKPLHHQIYAERFDADDLTESEWQVLELHFRDSVQTFRAAQAERRRRIMEGIPAWGDQNIGELTAPVTGRDGHRRDKKFADMSLDEFEQVFDKDTAAELYKHSRKASAKIVGKISSERREQQIEAERVGRLLNEQGAAEIERRIRPRKKRA